MQRSTRVLAASAVMTVMGICALPLAAQAPADAPVYTYVAEYRFKPGKAADFWGWFEKTSQPLLDGMVADGTLVEWGRSASTIHSADGMTDTIWWCAKTVGATQKVMEKMSASRPATVTDAVEKHSDRVLESIIFKTPAKKPAAAGYLETSSYMVKPGKGREWLDGFKKYQQPVYDKLLASGVIAGYGVDREAYHSMPGGFRSVWVLLPDADAIDKEGAAFDADAAKRSPEEGRAIQAAMADLSVMDQHKDGLDRVIKYVRK